MAMVFAPKELRKCPMCGREQENPYVFIEDAIPADQAELYAEKPWLQSARLEVKCENAYCGFEARLKVDYPYWTWGQWEVEKKKAIAETKRKFNKVWPLAKTPQKAMPMTAECIEVSLARYFDYRRNTIVPNVAWGMGLHECDVLVVTASGYATEVEIKISVSDMRADLKKRHGHRSNRIKQLYYCVPRPLQEKVLPLVPENAGLLVISPETFHISVVKPAVVKKLCVPFTPAERRKLLELGTLRIWGLKQRLHNVESDARGPGLMWFDEDGPCPSPEIEDVPGIGEGLSILEESPHV